MVFARVRPPDPFHAVAGGHVRFLFEDRLVEGASVSQSVSGFGSSDVHENKSCSARKTTNSSSSHTPIWPFVNQRVGSGAALSRWSEIAE